MKKVIAIFCSLIIIAVPVMAQADSSRHIISVQAYAENLAGTETRLLPESYDVWASDWSPDGKSLVFAGKEQGKDATKMKIWYWGMDSAKKPVQLTDTDELMDYSPRWSPDGTKIAITRRNFAKLNSTNSAIWVKEISGGAGRQLTQGPEDRDPFWSPDGTQLVYSRGQGPFQSQLVIVNFDDGKTKVVAGETGELIYSPWWGRDGKIYYTKHNPTPRKVTVSGKDYQVMDFGKGEIWSYNPKTDSKEPVIVDQYDNRTPALSPDGTKLAFISSRIPVKEGNGRYDRGSLYIKDLESGEILYVTNKVGLVGGSLSWRPDGKKIAFFTFRSIRPAIWTINL
jgi:TolB protein